MATYTPEQQAEISRRYPTLEWVNGQPYTRASASAPPPEPGVLDYLGRPVEADTSNTLVPAHTTDQNFPWEFFVAQAAAPALVAGGQAGVSALANAGGAAGGAGAATGAGTGAGVGAGTGAGVAAGTTAAGGGMWGTILSQGLPIAADFLGGLGQGMTDQRTQQDQRALTQDQLRLSAAAQEANNEGNRAQIQIQQQAAAEREQADAYRKALLAAMALNMRDATIDRSQFQTRVPTISFGGGLRPSVLGEQGQRAASVLSQQAQTRLENPTKAEPLPTYSAPAMSEASKAGFWERLVSPVAAGLSIYNGLQPTTSMPATRSVWEDPNSPTAHWG